MTENKEDKSIILGWLQDPSRVQGSYAPDGIYERLFDEVFGTLDVTRSHVITLHLYVEYWLDRILDKLGVSTRRTFHLKIDVLKKRGVLEDNLAENLETINSLRNIYAHELDLASANVKVQDLISKFRFDPYFRSTDSDPLRSICIQVMFLLEATFHNDCKPPKLPNFPHADARARLQRDGKLHWQNCEIVSREEDGYIEHYVLRCPFCQKGTILRERDSTPGFKDAFMTACTNCGLSGNGYDFELDTFHKTHNAG